MISLLTGYLALGLAGCADTSLRTGINPVLDVASVQSAAANQAMIVDALAADAGSPSTDPEYYYRAAEAGFNYVDDQCSAYFDYMFFFDRRRNELKSGLATAGATTGAILGLTNASTMSLAIVASAFGFASNATDIVAGTYVFAHPSETKMMVEKFQKAFRDAAFANRAGINSRSSTYYMVQRYLSLCLPPTIEAEIARQIGATTVAWGPAGGGALVSVVAGSSLPARPALPQTGRQAGRGATAQAGHTLQPQETIPKGDRQPKQPPVASQISQFFKDYDPQKDQAAYIHAVLKKLCVPDAEESNPPDEWVQRVRTLIAIFEDIGDLDVTPTKDGLIDRREGKFILSPENGPPECLPDQLNFYEKISFPDGKATPRLLAAINMVLNGECSPDKTTAGLEDVRSDIIKLRGRPDISGKLTFTGDFVSGQITPDLIANLPMTCLKLH